MPDESHLIIRNLIACVLHKKQIRLQNKKLYERFTKILQDKDLIITLNYDTILEKFYKSIGKEFNFYPPDLKPGLNFNQNEAATLLKLHGSINWFDYKEYEELVCERRCSHKALSIAPFHFVFNPKNYKNYKDYPCPLIPSKTQFDTRLKDIYWISDKHLKNYINQFKKTEINNSSPIILSPSSSKLLYIEAIKDLFSGLGSYGLGFNKIIIIGCSFPKYDHYIRLLIYHIIKNYYGDCTPKKQILVINKCDQDALHQNYSFIPKQYLKFITQGFTLETINEILD